MNTTKSRALTQSSANTDTKMGIVQKTYLDQYGAVSHADVLLNGEVNQLKKIENSSGLALFKWAPVVVNFLNGKRTNPSIAGFAPGAGQSVTGQNYQGDQAALFGEPFGTQVDTSGVPFLLQLSDLEVPYGYVLTPGANISLVETSAPAQDVSGNPTANGVETIAATPTVSVTTLPGSGSFVGQVVDLVDTATPTPNPLGMYRWDGTHWVRRDLGAVGDHKVLNDGADATADYLTGKLNATAPIQLATDTSVPTNHKTKITVDKATTGALGVVRGPGTGNIVVETDGSLTAPNEMQVSEMNSGSSTLADRGKGQTQTVIIHDYGAVGTPVVNLPAANGTINRVEVWNASRTVTANGVAVTPGGSDTLYAMSQFNGGNASPTPASSYIVLPGFRYTFISDRNSTWYGI